MNKFYLCIILIMCSAAKIRAQGTNASLVDFKGKPAVTVFKNKSADTIQLKGAFFNWLPYVEHPFLLTVPPGGVDSLIFQFNYPDFITINSKFRILNAPGKRVVCVVRDFTIPIPDIDFEGDLNLENTYYLSYNSFIGNPDQEGRPYYAIGDKISSFNNFPVKADSVTAKRIVFLAKYQQPLSPWFKKHEYWRLTYNGIMRKYNVLASKRFQTGKPLPVDDDYYAFEKNFKLINNEMAINNEYLMAADYFLLRASQKLKVQHADPMLWLIDSLAGKTGTGDILKARRLGVLYTHNKARYDSVFASVKFHDPVNKDLTDSLIQTSLGLPKVNIKPPDLAAKDMSGKDVFLSAYAGKPIIINFWAEWCTPCIAEFPAENKLYNRYKDQGLVVINVCVESDAEHWKVITRRDNLQMINWYIGADAYKKIKAAYNIGALPRSIAISKDYKVVANYYTRASLLSDGALKTLLTY